jgi:hypothetical protein
MPGRPGIAAQPPEVLNRIGELFDEGRTYAVIQAEIQRAFKVRLSRTSLSDYYQKRGKLKLQAAEAARTGAASVTIAISGPVKITIVCDGGAEIQQQAGKIGHG